MKFPEKKYSVIYADPPWDLDFTRTHEKGKFEQYPTMKTKDICDIPVEKIANESCVLFLWTTNTFIPDALEVIKSWGFKYHCCIVWNKQGGISVHGFHGVTEFLFFAYKDRFPKHTWERPIKTLITSPRIGHSKKPAIFRQIIEQKFKGDKIELFARNKIEGWDCWGNEIPTSEQKRLT